MTEPSARARDIANTQAIHVVQGEHAIAAEPSVMMTTVLGSCVAACLRDPVAGIGGMNHFLLPGGGDGRAGEAMRFGAYAMELLVNGLLSRGAQRGRLEAKLFGGACLVRGLTDVGALNADFAEDYLRREGVAYLGGSLRGRNARRIQFWPVSGRARQIVLPDYAAAVEAPTPRALPVAEGAGALELF